MNVIQKAKDLALEKHKDLCRPNASAQPLTEHLGEVAAMVEKCGLSDNAIAAAWLHDIVEDTGVTFEDIDKIFGADVLRMIEGLTDPTPFIDMPLEQRKQAQADRLCDKDDDIKIIKICDQISNTQSVLYDPPTDWLLEKSFLYIQGAKKIADVCRGIRPELDQEFDTLYDVARKKYGEEQ